MELDGQPSLKLPYNVSEDPWMAAHKWLEKHELSPLFLGMFSVILVIAENSTVAYTHNTI